MTTEQYSFIYTVNSPSLVELTSAKMYLLHSDLKIVFQYQLTSHRIALNTISENWSTLLFFNIHPQTIRIKKVSISPRKTIMLLEHCSRRKPETNSIKFQVEN